MTELIRRATPGDAAAITTMIHELAAFEKAALDKAADDYANSFRILRPHADFFVVNVSSPNTPNLRQLQDKAALERALVYLRKEQEDDGSWFGRWGTNYIYGTWSVLMSLAQAHVDMEVFHGGIEKLFQLRTQAMNFIDEEDVAGA